MGGAAIKVAIGAFFIWASAQMGDLAGEILGRVRLSAQASELVTLDKYLAGWTIEQRRTHPPKTQQEFEKVCEQLFTSRGEREVTRDRWGQPYTYELLKERPVAWRISSRGPDRRPGTEDDLVLERHEDKVWMNRDPAEIAEGALSYKKARDKEILARLREQGRKSDLNDGDAQERMFEEGPAADAAADRRQKKQLDQSLRDLDRLLDR